MLLPTFAIAENISVAGKMEVTIFDGLDFAHSKIEYALKDNRGRKYRLSFSRAPSGLKTGQKVTIRGKKLSARRIRVSSSDMGVSTLGDEVSISVSGSLTVVVLRIQSTTSVSSTTLPQLASEVAAVDLRLREHSGNLASLDNDKDNDSSADVLNVFVNQSTAGAGEEIAFSLCSQAIVNAGVTGYNHYVCILPPDMNYSWYGQAYIGGSSMVINGNYASGYPNGLEHEMGHNWGRHHANTPGVEYGDSSCIMGGNAGTANRHFNGPQKLGLGWVTATNAGDDTYILTAIEATTGTRLLKVRDTVASADLYISTRARIGDFSGGPIIPNTTHIHEWAGFSNKTFLRATLSNGQSFSQNGITITQVSQNETTTTVSVSGSGTCTRQSPSVSISPSNHVTQTLTPFTYGVTIENKDTNCGPTTFSLEATSSNISLGANLSSATIQLSAGQFGSVNIEGVPSINLASGNYTINLEVAGNNHTDVSSSAGYQYSEPTPTPIPTSTATASPSPTPVMVPTETPTNQDKEPPVVQVKNVVKRRGNLIKLGYSVSDESNKSKDTIEIGKNSRSVISINRPLLKIPSSNRRSVSIKAAKLTKRTYSYCITASDEAQNSSKKCAKLFLR